jgi:catecholate siderophore receptor
MSRSNLSSRDAGAHSPVHATDTVHGIDTVRRPCVTRRNGLIGPGTDGTQLPLGALMLAASVSAWAQSSAPADPPTRMLPTIDVKSTAEASDSRNTLKTTTTGIGKGTQEIRDIPQSMSVVTEKLITDRRLDTLKEALQHTAGITFAATENGTDQDIRLRGFPIATVGDLFIDGMRDPSQYDRDTFNMDRIEVLRGSASMLFGRGSTGGVINQVSKQPMLFDQYDLTGTISSRGYFRTTADLNKQTGENSAFRLNLMVNKADNGGATIDKYGIAPTFRWGIGTRDEFSVGLFHLKVDNVPFPGVRWLEGRVAPLQPGKYYGLASDQLLGEATYGTFSHTHRFDDGGRLRTQVRSGTYDRTFWGSVVGFPQGTTAASLNSNTILTRNGLNPRQDVYKTTYLQSDYTNRFDWGGRRHDITAGVDFAYEGADRDNAVQGTVPAQNTRPTTTIGTPDDGLGIANTIQWRQTEGYKARSMGVYLQDLIQIAPHWKILAGLRWDSFKGGFDSYPANASPVRTSLSNALFSYRTGVLYQPTDTSSFHFSYGTSFNTSADTYRYTNQTNANTPPEKSRNIELGAKLDWLNGNLSTRFAIFRTEKYNERNTDVDSAANQYLLSGARHSDGVEIDLAGRLSRDWEIYVSFAHIWTAVIDEAASTAQAQAQIGQRAGLTPKNSGSVWLSYQATPQLRIAAGINGRSRNYPLTVAGNNSARGYVVGDLMAEYKFTRDTYAQLNVINVANKLYGDQLYPGFVVTGLPRTVKLTVGTRFF